MTTRTAAIMIACALAGIGSAFAINPDPDIFDASKNGASSNGGKISPNISINGTPIGGDVSVVDEGSLPPLDVVIVPDINLELPGRGTVLGQPNGRGGLSSSGTSPIMLPIGGGMGGSQQSSKSPFPQKPQSSKSSSQQQQQQSQNSKNSSGEGSESSAEQPKAAKSSDSPMSNGAKITGKIPEPPPNQEIGDTAAQIDPDAEYNLEEMELDAEAEGSNPNAAPQSGKKRASSSSDGGDDSKVTDGQEMPGDIGGNRGRSRGSGTVEDVAVPSNL